MKKNVLSIVLAMLLCMAIPGIALADRIPYAVEGGNIYFDTEEGAVVKCDATITNAVIPDKINGIIVKEIDFLLVFTNPQLTSITIPATVEKIFFGYAGTPNLQEIKIDANNPYFTSDGLSIFNKDKTELIICKDNSPEYTIPNGVQKIGYSAFIGLNNLTSINVPISVKDFNPTSFSGCDNLKDVYYQGTEEQWKKINYDEDLGKEHWLMPSELEDANIHFNSSKEDNIIKLPSSQSILQVKLTGLPMTNGTTIAPMRMIFEALEAEVNYDAATQKITATKGDTVIELVIGQKTAKKNGQKINLDVPAVTQYGSTMVPLRFVAEALNAQVDWDNATQTVIITLAE